MSTEASRGELIASGIIAPRAPTVADRRKIMDELELSYDIKACCYINGLSDERVSQTLGLPRAWIGEVRSQFFGELNVNADELAVRNELTAALAEFKQLKGRIGQLEGKIAELVARADRVLGGGRPTPRGVS